MVEVPDDLKLYRSGLVGELRSELYRLIRENSKGA